MNVIRLLPPGTADRIATVTVDSVFDWMAARGLGGPPARLAPP